MAHCWVNLQCFSRIISDNNGHYAKLIKQSLLWFNLQTFSLSDMKTLVQRLSDQYNDSTHEEKIPRALIPEKLGDYNRVLKDSEELNKVQHVLLYFILHRDCKE